MHNSALYRDLQCPTGKSRLLSKAGGPLWRWSPERCRPLFGQQSFCDTFSQHNTVAYVFEIKRHASRDIIIKKKQMTFFDDIDTADRSRDVNGPGIVEYRCGDFGRYAWATGSRFNAWMIAALLRSPGGPPLDLTDWIKL